MKYRRWIGVALAVALAAPVWTEAQETPRPPRREGRAFAFSGQRGRIGVVVNPNADPDWDKLGARLEAVTPGGPAAKAGLKAGDVITKFGTTTLAGLAAEERDESGPGMKLIELARALDPGDTVQVEYRRANETKRATIVAQDLDTAWNIVAPKITLENLPRAGRDFMVEPDIRVHLDDDEHGGFGFSFGMPWGDLELVRLNPDLGEYFGTREGVLVVKAPADSGLPLRGGDVILSIGGRKPTSPSHAMRILRSYAEGETVSIEVMRKQRRSTLSWTVPEHEMRPFKRRERERERYEPT